MNENMFANIKKHFDKANLRFKPPSISNIKSTKSHLETPRQQEVRQISYRALPLTAFILGNNSMVLSELVDVMSAPTEADLENG